MGDYIDYPFMKISHKFPKKFQASIVNHQNQCRIVSINRMVAPCWPYDSLQPLLVFQLPPSKWFITMFHDCWFWIHRNPSSLSMTRVTKNM